MYAKRRDANEQHIIDVLKKIGVNVWPMHTPVDLLCHYRGRFFCLEVKNPDGLNKITPIQEAFFKIVGKRSAAVVRSEQEALDFVNGLI